MSVTYQEAMTEDSFHAGECKKIVGKRGGVKIIQEVWRRNGQTQTWKTRPGEFRIPTKYGLYRYGDITERNPFFHAASACPLRDKE
jgi:hypothetical protein